MLLKQWLERCVRRRGRSVVFFGVFLFVLASWFWCGRVAKREEIPSRVLLNRPWLDRFPERENDKRILWIWFAGGLVLFEEGSEWRGRFDVAEFERNDRNLRGRWLHDRKRFKTRFKVERCEDAPAPFDLCLTMGRPPRGPKRLYSWAHAEDAARYLPELSARIEAFSSINGAGE